MEYPAYLPLYQICHIYLFRGVDLVSAVFSNLVPSTRHVLLLKLPVKDRFTRHCFWFLLVWPDLKGLYCADADKVSPYYGKALRYQGQGLPSKYSTIGKITLLTTAAGIIEEC